MKSWGILGEPSEEKIQEWMDMPYGSFKKMVADVKKKTKGKPLKEFKIEIFEITNTYRSASVTVDAATSDHAVELAKNVNKDELKWSDVKDYKGKNYSYRFK